MSVVQAVPVEGRREETRVVYAVPALLYRNRWPAWTPLPPGKQARRFDRGMRRLLERMGCAVVKRYAVYERDLGRGTHAC
jgi:hypothetical protein